MAIRTELGRKDQPIEFVDDLRQLHDRLQLLRYAESLADFIAQCATPMAIAVQGEWGSGKTSLMNMIRSVLQNQEVRERTDRQGIRCYTFETWAHGVLGQQEQLGIKLLHDLVRRLADADPKNDAVITRSLRLREALRRIPKAMAVGGVDRLSLGFLHGETLLASDSAAEPLAESAVDAYTDLRKRFSDLVRQALGRDDKKSKGYVNARLVVFVDDLDRVRPEAAVTMLEVLKNFMDVEGCVFVVACDYEVVRQGVKARFDIGDPDKAHQFFHKIFQVPFRMPIEQYSVAGLLSEFLAQKAGKSANKAHLNSLANLAMQATGSNPRSFIRFLNLFELQLCLLAKLRTMSNPTDVCCDPAQCAALVGLVAMQMRWPAVASYLSKIANSEGGAEDQVAQVLMRLREVTDEDETDEVGTKDAALTALHTLLKRTYGEKWRDCRDVGDLVNFSYQLVDALDVGAEDGVNDADGDLQPRETAIITGLAKTLSLTGMSTLDQPSEGWARFQHELQEHTGNLAPAILRFVDELADLCRNTRAERGDCTLRFSRSNRVCVDLDRNKHRVATLISMNERGDMLLPRGPYAERQLIAANTDLASATDAFIAKLGTTGVPIKPKGNDRVLVEMGRITEPDRLGAFQEILTVYLKNVCRILGEVARRPPGVNAHGQIEGTADVL